MSIGYILLFLLMGALVLVLIAGFFTMLKGGEKSSRTGNKLMVARVALQAAVIGLIGIMFLLKK